MMTHTLSSACTQLRLVLGAASAAGQSFGRGQVEEALHDPLTTLPNRTLLHDRLRQAIRAARREGSSLSFLLMDLDRFKEINAAFGHAPQIRDLLADLGCDMAQGYGLSRPLPAGDLTRWLQESHRAGAT
jgi:predicted signal transduction protein with EAL and GGDEF domain